MNGKLEVLALELPIRRQWPPLDFHLIPDVLSREMFEVRNWGLFDHIEWLPPHLAPGPLKV